MNHIDHKEKIENILDNVKIDENIKKTAEKMIEKYGAEKSLEMTLQSLAFLTELILQENQHSIIQKFLDTKIHDS